MKKRILSLLLAAMLAALSVPMAMAEEDSFDIYVSPNGDDAASGTITEPLKTIEGAKAKVRNSEYLGKKKINVIFREGKYPIYDTIEFDAKDSGKKDFPVTYKAYEGEDVYFDGGVTLDPADAKEVTDADILRRLNPDAKDHIKVIDLKEYGITEIPPQLREDYYIVNPYSPMRFYIDDSEQELARWPNADEEMVLTGDVIFAGTGHGGKNWDTQPATFTYLDERIENWENIEDVWIWGEFAYAWAPNATAIGSIDKEKNTLTMKYAGPGTCNPKKPYYYYNVLEELDVPGEFYADAKTCKLYYYSTGEEDEMYLTYTPNTLINFKYTQYVTFEGITMQGSRDKLVSGSEGRAINIESCTLRYAGNQAVNITSGYDYHVNNCKVYEIGCGGIFITGGDKNLLKPSGVRITNNLCYNFSQWARTYASAIKAMGVYDVVANNEIHSGRHMALSLGLGAVAEYNDIYNMLTSSDDAGVVYAYMDASNLDIHFRRNFVHASSERGNLPATGCYGLYLDGWTSGWHVYENVFYDLQNGLFINGGQRCEVYHNLFIGCGKGIRAGATTGNASYPFWEKLDPYDWNKGIWAYKYPELIEYREGESKWTMSASNYICDNLAYDVYEHAFGMSVVPGREHTVRNNPIITEDIFTDIKNYDFSTNGKNPVEGMPDLDMNKVGRNKRTAEEIEAELPF